MFDHFLFNVLIAGFLLSLVAGPLGALVMWQRKAYFGDSLAHSAIVGIALSLILSINLDLSILFVLLLFSLLLNHLEKIGNIPSDTILGILAHSSLALGLVMISVKNDLAFDLETFLFGNILTVTKYDLVLMLILNLVIFIFLRKFWDKLILISLNKNLAVAELGTEANKVQFYFIAIFALFIALNIKIVGILLINALLLISAATSRQICNSAQNMAFWGSLFSFLGIAGGLAISYYFDVPTGGAIVVTLTTIFIVTLYGKKLTNF